MHFILPVLVVASMLFMLPKLITERFLSIGERLPQVIICAKNLRACVISAVVTKLCIFIPWHLLFTLAPFLDHDGNNDGGKCDII